MRNNAVLIRPNPPLLMDFCAWPHCLLNDNVKLNVQRKLKRYVLILFIVRIQFSWQDPPKTNFVVTCWSRTDIGSEPAPCFSWFIWMRNPFWEKNGFILIAHADFCYFISSLVNLCWSCVEVWGRVHAEEAHLAYFMQFNSMHDYYCWSFVNK